MLTIACYKPYLPSTIAASDGLWAGILAGARVAPFGLGAVLAEYGMAASVGGALFGLLVGLALSK